METPVTLAEKAVTEYPEIDGDDHKGGDWAWLTGGRHVCVPSENLVGPSAWLHAHRARGSAGYSRHPDLACCAALPGCPQVSLQGRGG